MGGQPQERQLLSSAWAQSDASARQKTRLGGCGPFLTDCYLPHAQGKYRLRGSGCKILGSNPLRASDTFSYEALTGTRSEGTHDTRGGIGIFRAEDAKDAKELINYFTGEHRMRASIVVPRNQPKSFFTHVLSIQPLRRI